MANAKLYRINTPALELKPKYVAGLKGQAKIVMDGLLLETEPILGKDLAAKLVFPGSKQDPYRVTLYYIIVFKGKGLVTGVDQQNDVEAEPQQLSLLELEESVSGS